MSGPVERHIHTVNKYARSTSRMWCRQAIQRRVVRRNSLAVHKHQSNDLYLMLSYQSKYQLHLFLSPRLQKFGKASAVSFPVPETSLGTPINLLESSSELLRGTAMRSTSSVLSWVSYKSLPSQSRIYLGARDAHLGGRF